MIDFHCHIIPGIDDGSANMEESIELARQSAAAGVTHVVATPHGSYENLEKVIAQRDELLKELERRIAEENIGITIVPGLEYMADGHSDAAALDFPGCRCGFRPDNSSPLLVELNFSTELTFAAEVLFKAQLKGIRLILAHPERYDGFVKNADFLMDLMDKGLFLQFNAGNFRRSLFFINSISKAMYKLMAHCPENVLIGSDAHNPVHRPAGLASAEANITSALGKDAWRLISQDNPKRLLGL